MAGHSHWAGIKHKKAAVDAKRGKIWSKLAKMIIAAARNGGADPSTNLPLRYAIDKAKAANMPKDNIEKAVKRGTGELEGVKYEEVIYEGYGPGGVAILIEALTDNRNRTTPEIKKIFERHGGSMGAAGCVSWMFTKKGFITVRTDDVEEDQLMEIALNAGADDLQNTGEVYELTCEPSTFEQLKDALGEKEIPIQVSEISMVPQSDIQITDKHNAEKAISLLEAIEDHDDVQNTHSNLDIPDEVLKTIETG